jgi:hypothetical protein
MRLSASWRIFFGVHRPNREDTYLREEQIGSGRAVEFARLEPPGGRMPLSQPRHSNLVDIGTKESTPSAI